MQIVIDIPKEFEEHFEADRFEDSLARIASDIESFGFPLAGRYEQETITMLRKAIKNCTILPNEHGRLIDADELLEKQYCIDDSATLSTRDVVDVEDVDDAPTIIDADMRGDE